MSTKTPIQSKTLWFNVLSIAGIILASPTFQSIDGPYALLIAGAISLVNMGLRFTTTTELVRQ